MYDRGTYYALLCLLYLIIQRKTYFHVKAPSKQSKLKVFDFVYVVLKPIYGLGFSFYYLDNNSLQFYIR